MIDCYNNGDYSFLLNFFGFGYFLDSIIVSKVCFSSFVFDRTCLKGPSLLGYQVIICDNHIVEREQDNYWIENDEGRPEEGNVVNREGEAAINKRYLINSCRRIKYL